LRRPEISPCGEMIEHPNSIYDESRFSDYLDLGVHGVVVDGDLGRLQFVDMGRKADL